MEITLAVILSYISNYLLSFVISLLGAFTNEMMTAMQSKTKISIIRTLVPGFFDAFLLCAIQSKANMEFAMYAFVCFMCGMWGLRIIEIISNNKFVFVFLKSFLKSSSLSIAKAAGESLEELKKEEVKNNEEKDDPKKDLDDKKECE